MVFGVVPLAEPADDEGLGVVVVVCFGWFGSADLAGFLHDVSAPDGPPDKGCDPPSLFAMRLLVADALDLADTFWVALFEEFPLLLGGVLVPPLPHVVGSLALLAFAAFA